MICSVLLPALNCGIAFSQQLAFSSRAVLQSPVVVASFQSSKEFGFRSVVLRNDGSQPVKAVYFKVTWRADTDIDEEPAGERRTVVTLEPTTTKQVLIDLGDVEGLTQLVKSRKKRAATVILTIESIEFEDGHEWHNTEQDGVPSDLPRLKFK
ncbi:MAG TPA: hypothetical protein VK789_28720 [Bryobacteraceae bacterium]|nr:hypothetical protein [Bryobacteraceae bacterium]